MTNEQIKYRLEFIRVQMMRPIGFVCATCLGGVFISAAHNKPELTLLLSIVCTFSAAAFAYLTWLSMKLIKQLRD